MDPDTPPKSSNKKSNKGRKTVRAKLGESSRQILAQEVSLRSSGGMQLLKDTKTNLLQPTEYLSLSSRNETPDDEIGPSKKSRRIIINDPNNVLGS